MCIRDSPLDLASPIESFGQQWPPEQELKLDATYEGKSGEIAWTDMTVAMLSDDDYQAMDFVKGISDVRGSTVYAHTYVHSPADQDAVLKIGHSRYLTVFLNGDNICDKPVTHRFMRDRESVKVRLKQGANSLLVKTGNTGGLWKVSLKFVDAEGKLLRGLKFTRQRER